MNASPVLAGSIARNSLFWLVAANLVGVWLASCLLFPALGDVVAPLTYGRWVPLHLNWQLYGWCSLPVVGVLLGWGLDPRHPRADRHARIALGAWSLALVLGGATWLAGINSGKLFLDWYGPARGLIPAAMIVLWTVLAAHTWWRRRELSRPDVAGRLLLLAALATVPPAFFLSAGREYYPAVNPDSGGATGAALLGSTLAIVTLFGFLPVMLGRTSARPVRVFWIALGVSWAVFGGIDHGSTSHHAVGQILGLGVLLAWVPLLVRYWTQFDWPVGTARWLIAAGAWWLLLVVTGWLAFLPQISETLKFTDGLVAHAHLAMAGLITSVNGVVLLTLGARFGSRRSFWLWQGACAVHVAVLLLSGVAEQAWAGAYYRNESWVVAAYAVRLGAGLAMALASWQWWKEVRA